MQIRNFTPYPHLTYANEDAEARLFDILIVKQSFHLDDAGELVHAPEQEPLNFSDGCVGEVNETALVYPSDLVPFKPVTDVIVIAESHAPGGEPSPAWDCAVSVSGEAGFDKVLSVTGPRHWHHKRGRGWRLDDPAPIDRLPIRWDYAYGGEVEVKEGAFVLEERNPLGRGLIAKGISTKDPVPAPQIQAPDQPVVDPTRRYPPQSFGPIPPAWLPRRPLGGTYDEDWLETTWPHWASDYDFAFHNSAGPGMKAKGYLRGDETLRFSHLRAGDPDLSVTLPGDQVIAHLLRDDGSRSMIALNLDTVYVDLTPEDPEDCLIALTWRLAFLEAGVKSLEIDSAHVANPVRLWAEGDGITSAPHPAELFAATDETAEKEHAHVE